MRTMALAAMFGAVLAITGSPAFAQSSSLRPFPLTGPNSAKNDPSVTISVSYQFFLEGDIESMADQAALADKGRKHLYKLLAKECVVLRETIAETCALDRANVNAQMRNVKRSQKGIRISGSATYRIRLKDED